MGGNSSKSNKASRITEQDKAILQLKQMRDKKRKDIMNKIWIKQMAN